MDDHTTWRSDLGPNDVAVLEVATWYRMAWVWCGFRGSLRLSIDSDLKVILWSKRYMRGFSVFKCAHLNVSNFGLSVFSWSIGDQSSVTASVDWLALSNNCGKLCNFESILIAGHRPIDSNSQISMGCQVGRSPSRSCSLYSYYSYGSCGLKSPHGFLVSCCSPLGFFGTKENNKSSRTRMKYM